MNSEIERLRGLISMVKRTNSLTDFNSETYDLLNMLEDQAILVSKMAQQEQLSKQESRIIKRLILEAQFLII